MFPASRGLSSGGGSKPPVGKNPLDKKQLRHDRWVAAAVMLAFAALMALFVWLASLSGGEAADYPYWMMP